jgi:hypothetical protein
MGTKAALEMKAQGKADQSAFLKLPIEQVAPDWDAFIRKVTSQAK